MGWGGGGQHCPILKVNFKLSNLQFKPNVLFCEGGGGGIQCHLISKVKSSVQAKIAKGGGGGSSAPPNFQTQLQLQTFKSWVQAKFPISEGRGGGGVLVKVKPQVNILSFCHDFILTLSRPGEL